MTDANPQIGLHMATLNLFLEPNSEFHITVADADSFMKYFIEEPKARKHRPIWYVERAIIEAAERIAERHAKDDNSA